MGNETQRPESAARRIQRIAIERNIREAASKENTERSLQEALLLVNTGWPCRERSDESRLDQSHACAANSDGARTRAHVTLNLTCSLLAKFALTPSRPSRAQIEEKILYAGGSHAGGYADISTSTRPPSTLRVLPRFISTTFHGNTQVLRRDDKFERLKTPNY